MRIGRVRIAILAAVVCLLGLASFWPLASGWRTGLAGPKWELALLELRYPLFSVSTEAKRAILEVRTDPYRHDADSHLLFTRGAGSRLWLDGRERVELVNPPPAPLIWSVDQRLWLGGVEGIPGPPMVVRRLAVYDRALNADEAARLFAAGRRGPAPEPLLQFEFAGGIDQRGSVGPVKLELPPGATLGEAGLALEGGAVRSTEPLHELMESIRERQEFSVELLWRPAALPALGALPIVAFEGEAGSRNFRIDASRDALSIRVRAGYPARKRVTDFILNVAAYIPLGLVLVWGRRGAAPILLACAGGFLMSLGVETLQTFREDRIPSLIDLFTNTLGATLGGAFWWLYARCREGSSRG